jgi:ATPase subunit of ABC transporter with duplicated ATPase domains
MMKETANSRAYLSRFNLVGRTKQSFHVRRTNRLHLANDFKREGNVLLDEPTNDLDINHSCLREGLESFAGCAV